MIHLRRPPVVLFGQCWRGGGRYLERAAHPVGLQGSAKQRAHSDINPHASPKAWENIDIVMWQNLRIA